MEIVYHSPHTKCRTTYFSRIARAKSIAVARSATVSRMMFDSSSEMERASLELEWKTKVETHNRMRGGNYVSSSSHCHLMRDVACHSGRVPTFPEQFEGIIVDDRGDFLSYGIEQLAITKTRSELVSDSVVSKLEVDPFGHDSEINSYLK